MLASLDEEIEVKAGQTVELFVNYTDPNNKDAHIGGAEMIVPIAGTDYTAWDGADGAGSLITSQVDLSSTEFSGSDCKIVATNNAATTGYLRGPGAVAGMQVRGRPLYRYSPVSRRGKGSADSITDYGERWLRIDMPYQDNVEVAQDVANFIANLHDGILNIPTEVAPMTERPEVLASCLSVDIGSRVKVTEQESGVDGAELFVNGLRGRVLNNVVSLEWIVAPADTTAVFILDDPVAGILDANALGY